MVVSHVFNFNIRQDDLDLYMVPLSTLWGGVPTLTTEDIITNQTNISQLMHDKLHRYILCCNQTASHDRIVKSHSCSDVVSKSHSCSDVVSKSHSCSDVVSKSHSDDGNEKSDHRDYVITSIDTAQGSEFSCVGSPSNHQSQHHIEYKVPSVNDSGYITLDNDHTLVFQREKWGKEAECVLPNKDKETPIIVQDSSVEVVSETDSEDCYLDLKSFRRNQNTILPGIQSVCYKSSLWTDTSSTSSIQHPLDTIQHPLDTIQTSKSSTRLSTCPEHKPFLLAKKPIHTAHTDVLPLPNDQGVSSTVYPGSKFTSPCHEQGSLEDESMKDEGIVVDGSCEEMPTVVSDSSDDVTIVKVEEGRGNGHIGMGNQVTTQWDMRLVVDYCGIRLTQADLDTLRPYRWLNDQVSVSENKFAL